MSKKKKYKMSGRVKDIAGEVFGRLTVIGFAYSKNGGAYWNCNCKCGGFKEVRANQLKTNKVRSCGCLYNESRKTCNFVHGMTGDRFYDIYNAMKSRCYYEKNNMYKYYGGRGISVCDRWLESFNNFKEDMYGEYCVVVKEFHNCCIDRIRNDENYEPSNCRWVSQKANNNNKSDKGKGRLVSFDDAEKIRVEFLTGDIRKFELAKKYGVSQYCIRDIIKRRTYREK